MHCWASQALHTTQQELQTVTANNNGNVTQIRLALVQLMLREICHICYRPWCTVWCTVHHYKVHLLYPTDIYISVLSIRVYKQQRFICHSSI